jgi:hypothetical protein
VEFHGFLELFEREWSKSAKKRLVFEQNEQRLWITHLTNFFVVMPPFDLGMEPMV